MELRGLPCLALEDVAPQRKGMACTRSFGRVVTSKAEMLEAVASHASRAGEKLRQHGLVAGKLTAFFHTSPHRCARRRESRPLERRRDAAAGGVKPGQWQAAYLEGSGWGAGRCSLWRPTRRSGGSCSSRGIAGGRHPGFSG